QDIPTIALKKYLESKGYTFNVLEYISLSPSQIGYNYWDAFMILLIKYLCDPMSDVVELMCEFDKKVFLFKNENVPEKNTSFTEISLTKSISEEITNMEMKSEQKTYKDNKSENIALDAWGQIISKEKINKQKKSQIDQEADCIKPFTKEKTILIAEKTIKCKKSECEQKSQQKEASLKAESCLSNLEDKKEEEKTNKVIEEAKKKIFVYNIPKELKSEDLDEMFKACGDIEEFDKEVIENTEAAFSSVKFKEINSVYRAYRLLNGISICGQTLSIVIPLEDSFAKKEKEVKKLRGISEKQAYDCIQKVVSKVEKKEKLLKSYLNSDTREKETKMLSKKEVGKEEIDKNESAREAKKKEEIVEENDIFDFEGFSSPTIPCIDSDKIIKDDHNSDEDNDKKRDWRTDGDKRNKSNQERKRNEEKKWSRSPSNGQGHASRSKHGRDSSPQNQIKNKSSKDKNVDPGGKKRSRSKDRKDRTSSSRKYEGPSSGQKKYNNSENSRSSRTHSNASSSKNISEKLRSKSQERIKRSRSRDINRERIKRSKSRNIDLNRKKRSRSRNTELDRKKRSRSRNVELDRQKRSRSRDTDLDKKKRSRSRDADRGRKKRSGSKDTVRDRKNRSRSRDNDQ
ncbi:unnamed protein product, partial [Meganyctiphanes norvegica]